MRVFSFIFLLLGVVSAWGQGGAAPVKIKITGEIDSAYQGSQLLIYRQNDNLRRPTALINVDNGIIDYDFEADEPDQFSLLSYKDMSEKGTWVPMSFFAEDGEIRIIGVRADEDPNCLQLKIVESTSPLNSKLIEYKVYEALFHNQLDSIVNLMRGLGENVYSTEGKAMLTEVNALSEEISQFPDSLPLLQRRSELYQGLDSLKRERAMYSSEYYQLYDAQKAIVDEMLGWEIDTYAAPDGDLFSLSVLSEAFSMAEGEENLRERIISAYIDNFRDRFANTRMGRRMDEAVVGYEVSHVGGRYPNYQLPDVDGAVHNIHDLINGRLVLIDLWGSTCGPCRVNSRLLIPVYNEFKDKGFDIIGIAREYGSLDGFHLAVEKDGYPWHQLIELDDATGIFNLHGIPESMGGTYLVGPSSASEYRILLINPTPAQLREFLSEYYE